MEHSKEEKALNPVGVKSRVASPWAMLPVLLFAVVILSIGIGRDYRLKHEDNNALHATFGRAHVEAGFEVTKAHDAYVNRENGRAHFYAHHPPGCGLVLAAAFGVTGSDRPEVVRGVAIAATLTTLILLWWIVRREIGPGTALVAALVFAVLPQAAFYGRMVNHEVLALPFIVVLVDRYFTFARGGGTGAVIGLVLGAMGGALFGWVTFFSLAACAAHAAVSMKRRESFPSAGHALVLLIVLGVSLLAADLVHIAWVRGGDLSDLVAIFSRRLGAGQAYGPFEWAHKMLGFSRRLATATGTFAVIWLGVRAARALLGKTTLRPVEEIAAVFLGAGLGYLVVFNWGAWQHHYWQYPLLPAVVIALALAMTMVAENTGSGKRRMAWRVLLALMILEVIAASSAALYNRHTNPEDRVIKFVERHRSQFL